MAKLKVGKNGNSCALRWQYDGKDYSITHGRYDNPIDHEFMEKVASQIRLDFLTGSFDPTLKKYKTWEVEQKEVIEVNKLIDLWKLWIKSKDLSEETFHNHYRWIEIRIKQFNPCVSETSWLTSMKSAPSTYNKWLSSIKACFDWGIKNKFVECNPFDSVKGRKKKGDNVKPFSKDETQSILNAIADDSFCPPSNKYPHSWYLPFFQFLFATGLRPCEVIGLRWGSIDYEREFVHVREAISRSRVPGSIHRKRKSTKTGNEWCIPLTDKLKAILEAAKTQSKNACGKGDLVFHTPNKRPVSWDHLNKRLWKPVINGLEIEYRNPYQIRHTALSSAAMNPKIGVLGAAKLAGHRDASMVLKHYGKYVGTLELPDTFDMRSH